MKVDVGRDDEKNRRRTDRVGGVIAGKMAASMAVRLLVRRVQSPIYTARREHRMKKKWVRAREGAGTFLALFVYNGKSVFCVGKPQTFYIYF